MEQMQVQHQQYMQHQHMQVQQEEQMQVQQHEEDETMVWEGEEQASETLFSGEPMMNVKSDLNEDVEMDDPTLQATFMDLLEAQTPPPAQKVDIWRTRLE